MNLKPAKYIAFLAVLSILGHRTLWGSDYIYNLERPAEDTLYLGIVNIYDSVSTQFLIKNKPATGFERLYIGKALPSFYFGESPGHPNEFEEFTKASPSGQDFTGDFELLKDSSAIMKVTYTADDRLIKYPLGKKEMRIILGLYDPGKPAPITDKDLVVVDTFTVWAKKTLHFVDCYENYLRFDSVYIKPKLPPSLTWKLKNIAKVDEMITGQVFKDSSTKREFSFKGPSLPLTIEAGSPRSERDDWSVGYVPLDRGPDTSLLTISYQPLPKNLPDSTPMPWVLVTGVGVEQQIDLVDAGELPIIRKAEKDSAGYVDSVITYTIDAGDVRVGAVKTISGILQNNGNLQFKTISQELLSDKSDTPSQYFTLVKGLSSGLTSLAPGKRDTFKINFEPENIGDSVARFVVWSDISSRKIYGTPPNSKKLVFYIRARGIEPILSIESDTIDLGNVVIGCPPQRQEILEINNSGNEELKVQAFIKFPSAFNVEPQNITVAPFSHESFTFTYSIHEKSTFTQDVQLTTNETPPSDKRIIYFKGEGVPLRSSLLSMPDKRGKPGNDVIIPIILADKYAGYASKFTDILTYDQSLLRYDSYITKGTASEGSEFSEMTSIQEKQGGSLTINIEMPGKNQYFRKNDTLVLLRFKTYLGDAISTNISFMNPIFRDEICPEVVSLNPDEDIRNGTFTLDSICGLSLKAYKRDSSKFNIVDIYPNPASDKINARIEMAFGTYMSLEIIDTYGEKAAEIKSGYLPWGSFEFEINCSKLSSGLYYLRFMAGNYIIRRQFIIAK